MKYLLVISFCILGILDKYENEDRYWRKNRRQNLGGNICPEVDLNKNFSMDWGTASSGNPCSDTFDDRHQTEIIRDIVAVHSKRLALYLYIHSFGSVILYGYGNGDLPTNDLQLNLVGVQLAQAIERLKWLSKRSYIVGHILHELNYATSGGASDYALMDALFSYTYKLPVWRSNARLQGFLVDPEFIEQSGFKTWEGIKVGAGAAALTLLDNVICF